MGEWHRHGSAEGTEVDQRSTGGGAEGSEVPVVAFKIINDVDVVEESKLCWFCRHKNPRR